MTERFMIDDCGTLIDMYTRDTFDYVSDVCDLLNEQHEQIQQLQGELAHYKLTLMSLEEEAKRLSQIDIEKFKKDLKEGNFIEYTAR